MNPTALIAEDEPLLAQALQLELQRAWPELQLLATVGDGLSAVQQSLALQPDVLFFDIRMPGQSGLDAAAALAEDWPELGKPFPQLVFVTAYDEHAVQAFEHQAVDYVLKPIRAERLRVTVQRLQERLTIRTSANDSWDTWGKLQALLKNVASASTGTTVASEPLLSIIQASVSSRDGAAIRMVPVDEVLYFEAADKYVRVLTTEHEYLIRTPIKDLLPRLRPEAFWQIHRSTVVRVNAISGVQRDEAGKLTLALHRHADKLIVSRLYSHLFKAM